jgi:hypothetical protein
VEAETSPVYVEVEGQQPPRDPAVVASFLGKLDRMLEWVATQGRFANDKQRDDLANVFQTARNELLRRQGS